jgi:hypothetical protein
MAELVMAVEAAVVELVLEFDSKTEVEAIPGGRNIAAVEHHQGNGNVPATQQNDATTNAGRGGRTGNIFGGG